MEDYSVPIESSNKLKIQSVVLSVIMFTDGSTVCNKKGDTEYYSRLCNSENRIDQFEVDWML